MKIFIVAHCGLLGTAFACSHLVKAVYSKYKHVSPVLHDSIFDMDKSDHQYPLACVYELVCNIPEPSPARLLLFTNDNSLEQGQYKNAMDVLSAYLKHFIWQRLNGASSIHNRTLWLSVCESKDRLLLMFLVIRYHLCSNEDDCKQLIRLFEVFKSARQRITQMSEFREMQEKRPKSKRMNADICTVDLPLAIGWNEKDYMAKINAHCKRACTIDHLPVSVLFESDNETLSRLIRQLNAFRFSIAQYRSFAEVRFFFHGFSSECVSARPKNYALMSRQCLGESHSYFNPLPHASMFPNIISAYPLLHACLNGSLPIPFRHWDVKLSGMAQIFTKKRGNGHLYLMAANDLVAPCLHRLQDAAMSKLSRGQQFDYLYHLERLEDHLCSLILKIYEEFDTGGNDCNETKRLEITRIMGKLESNSVITRVFSFEIVSLCHQTILCHSTIAQNGAFPLVANIQRPPADTLVLFNELNIQSLYFATQWSKHHDPRMLTCFGAVRNLYTRLMRINNTFSNQDNSLIIHRTICVYSF